MVARDKIVGSALIIIAAFFFAVGFRLELRSHISDFALFGALSVVLAFAGIYHISTARDRAERFSRELVAASPIRRLWLPPRFYSASRLLWQFRVGGAVALLSAAMLALVAFLAYRRGW